MPFVATVLIVFALAAAGVLRVVSTPDPTLLDVAPFLAAILAVPLALVRALARPPADTP